MRIRSSKEKLDLDKWTKQLTNATSENCDNIEVTASRTVHCPKANAEVSYSACELCGSCVGGYMTASSQEMLKCSFNHESEKKEASNQETTANKFANSSSIKKKSDFEDVDIEGIALTGKSAMRTIVEKQIDHPSDKTIIPSKAAPDGETMVGGRGTFVAKNQPTLLDPNRIANLEKDMESKEGERREADAKRQQEKIDGAKEWETDIAAKLESIKYNPEKKIQSISHETNINNPSIGDKFSVFENIDEKLSEIASKKSPREETLEQNQERKEAIQASREKDTDWQSVKKARTSNDVANELFDKFFE